MSEKGTNDNRPRRGEKAEILTRRRLKRPPLYRVIFHNDDYTTRDFVVMALMRYFYKSHAEANTLMLQVHLQGKGIAGIFPYDMATSKKAQVEGMAREHEFPLRVTVEPEDSGREEDE
jgi:ATP-dependent Clp protease adaptor protein ClpS